MYILKLCEYIIAVFQRKTLNKPFDVMIVERKLYELRYRNVIGNAVFF